jgi:hypothetical protein
VLSLHIIADNAPPERLDRAIDYLKHTKQPYVNIGGGSQVDRAMQLVERVQIEVPGIQVFWRVLEDTGNIIAMTAAQWWQERIVPRLKWMQEHNVIMVVDNESSGDDAIIKRYVEQSLIRMAMLHDNGLYGAFCRFATGNIQEQQYTLLKSLLTKLWPKDWVSPNEYSNLPGKSSGGHLERWKRIQAVSANKLQFAIGECGVLNDYRANDGYRNYVSGRAMAEQLIKDEVWYNNGAIPRFMFCIGGYSGWDSLQIGDDALDYLERHYAAQPIVKPPPPVPAPTTDTITVSRRELQSIQTAILIQMDALGDIIKKSQ